MDKQNKNRKSILKQNKLYSIFNEFYTWFYPKSNKAPARRSFEEQGEGEGRRPPSPESNWPWLAKWLKILLVCPHIFCSFCSQRSSYTLHFNEAKSRQHIRQPQVFFIYFKALKRWQYRLNTLSLSMKTKLVSVSKINLHGGQYL